MGSGVVAERTMPIRSMKPPGVRWTPPTATEYGSWAIGWAQAAPANPNRMRRPETRDTKPHCNGGVTTPPTLAWWDAALRRHRHREQLAPYGSGRGAAGRAGAHPGV